MKRRDFTKGMMASALAAPFITHTSIARANSPSAPFGQIARIKLKLENTSLQPDALDFTDKGRISYHLSLNRTFPQFKEDRTYIPNLNAPPLSHVFKGGSLVGDIRLNGITIVVVPQVKLDHAYRGIYLANQDRSFLIGDMLGEGGEASGDKIPGLSNLPVVGSLFRTKTRIEGKHELLILITPSVVKF